MGEAREYCKERDPVKTVEVLFDISEAVNTTRNLEALFQVIHQCLGKLLPADNLFIALHDADQDRVWFPYHVDERNQAPDEIAQVSQSNTLIRRIISRRQPLILNTEEIVAIKGCPTDARMWLGVPLMVQDRVIGVMVLQDYGGAHVFHREDLELLSAISRHVAVAIERKASEETIEEQRLLLEKILEASPMGIALVQDRVFKWVNQEMVRLFGRRNKAEFQDQSVRLIYGGEIAFEEAGEIISQSLDDQGLADYESDVTRADGSVFPAHIRVNCTDPEDPMGWAIATVTDISQRRAAEKETYERERLQGVLEMAGAVCHEINQPLQTILGYAELMLMGDEESNECRLASIKSQAARIGNITQKLSNITQYKTVEYPGNTKIVDIWAAGGEPDKSS